MEMGKMTDDKSYNVMRHVKYGEGDWREDEVLRSDLTYEEANELCDLLTQENTQETRRYAVQEADD